jgi:hypothetical protein
VFRAGFLGFQMRYKGPDWGIGVRFSSRQECVEMESILRVLVRAVAQFVIDSMGLFLAVFSKVI